MECPHCKHDTLDYDEEQDGYMLTRYFRCEECNTTWYIEGTITIELDYHPLGVETPKPVLDAPEDIEQQREKERIAEILKGDVTQLRNFWFKKKGE